MALKTLNKNTKNKVSVETIFQLAITLFSLYVANKISVDVWRSMTGH
jgi:hypothetical protein